MPKHLRRKFLVGFLTCITAVSGMSSSRWPVYTNVRYQYAVCYPAELLKPQGETVNSAGQTFLGTHGEQLVVYAEASPTTLASSYRFALSAAEDRSGAVAYKALLAHSYVISTRQNETISYRKTFVNNGEEKTLNLTYPVGEKAQFDQVTKVVSACFSDLSVSPKISMPR